MSQSRYVYNRIINNSFLSTRNASAAILQAVANGQISVNAQVLKEGTRLDQIAANVYGDSGYWWVIAAASGIGWGLQVPGGTIIRVPANIDSVFTVIANVR